MPVSAFGIARGLLGRLPRDARRPDRLRARPPARRPARTCRWLPRPLATLLDDAAELARASTMPRAPPPSPASAGSRRSPRRLLGAQMRRASIPALARVVHRLGVDADWVVFGHVHRLGPLARRRARPSGAARAAGRGSLNTGSWLYEPLLVHRARPPHPYWPGGAVLLDEAGIRARWACSTSAAARSSAEAQAQDQVAVAELVPEVAAARAPRRRSARAARRPAIASSICRCDASGSCQPVIRPSTARTPALRRDHEAGPAGARGADRPVAPRRVSSARTTVVPTAITRPPHARVAACSRAVAREPRSARGTAARGARARTRRCAA